LALRRVTIPGEIIKEPRGVHETGDSTTGFVKVENADQTELKTSNISEQEKPSRKKPRSLSLEEYEAALDQDTTFNDVDLGI
jgi:hypothetical protein